MAWRVRHLPVALVLASIFGGGADAAASIRRTSDEVLARSSAAAVRGTVVAVSPRWDAAVNAIYSHVTIEVARAWGLPGSPARVVVKQLGGVVGGTALVVGGQARFEPGEDVLVFLEVRPRDRTLYVAGFEQGKWTVSATGRPSRHSARGVFGMLADAALSREHRSIDELEALAALAGTVEHAGIASRMDSDLDLGLAGRMSAGPVFLSPVTPARWHEADVRTPVFVDTQAGGHPQIAAGGLAQLVSAAALWTAAGSLGLQPGVFRGPRCIATGDHADGRISVTYDDPCGEIANTGATLAIGGAYYSASDVRTVNGVAFWKMTAGMVVVDDAPSKFAGMSTGCYEDLLAHELGHTIGFGHASVWPAVMYPIGAPDCWSRTTALPLQASDLGAMALVYPERSSAAPQKPNGVGAAVSGSTVTVFWGPPTTGAPPTGYRVEAGSGPGLSDQGLVTVSGTSLLVPEVPNGAYYVRVRALAGAVAGEPTPDALVRVTADPPGTPVIVTAVAGPDRSVYIAWQPPLSGGAPVRYLLQAGLTPGATDFEFPTAATSIAGGDIAPATYYLRVVAVNGAGAGPASALVALVVR